MLVKRILMNLKEIDKFEVEQNRCAMACQGCGAAFFLNNKIGNGISC